MSRKRRVFELARPEVPGAGASAPASTPTPEPAPGPETFPAGKVEGEPGRGRRGPMATAVQENAEALRSRAEAEAAIRAENDALAHELVRLKREGLVVDLIPLDAIDAAKLARDRTRGPDMELGELKTSIRELGLSNPIRVEPRDDGRFELIQGFRRLSAWRRLLAETGDAGRWGAIPAGIVPRGDSMEVLYRRMVDENLVRKDISFAEMARLALDYAADPAVRETDPERAVRALYESAGYQKRSYIRGFLPLVAALGEDLRFAHHIPRALGLALAQRIEDQPEIARAIRHDLQGWDNRSVQDELNVLRRYVDAGPDGTPQPAAPGPMPGPEAKAPAPVRAGGAQTRFDLKRAQGLARCTVAPGRIEIRLDRDFSALERWRIEAAVRSLLDQLD